MSKKIKCPRWGCPGIGIPVDVDKKYSFTKGAVGNIVGYALAGPAGCLVGMANGIKGKSGKTKFVCERCGRVFSKKI